VVGAGEPEEFALSIPIKIVGMKGLGGQPIKSDAPNRQIKLG
jgi:hypothetical protein